MCRGGRAGPKVTAELAIDVQGGRAGGRVTAELVIDVEGRRDTAGVELKWREGGRWLN